MVAAIKLIRISLIITFVMVFGFGAHAQPSQTFKILSYNVWEGFQGADSAKIAGFKQWVKTMAPDVIALQEMNRFTAAGVQELAADMGYPYSAIHQQKGFPIAMLSRFPIGNIKKVTTGMTHGFLYGEVKGYHIFIVHLDPKTYQKRQQEVSRLLLSVDSIPNTEKVMVMGDFNNMSPQDAGDYNNEGKMKLVRASEVNHPGTHVINDGEIDYTAVQKMIDGGFTDSWRLLNKHYEKSAPTKVRTHQNYTRIDYIWVNQTLKPDCLKATIVKDDFTDYLSDHYPIILTLKNE